MAAVENQGLDNSPRVRRIIQAIVDLRGGNVDGARILDLGSAHGLYTLELARRGADGLGIEGRTAWIQQAEAMRDAHGLSSARFEHGDVREIAVEKLGRFDITLCLGLLYHLRANEASDLLRKLYAITDNFLVVDTQIALTPSETRLLHGAEYYGHDFPEHAVGASPEAMEADLGASLDTHESFWFTLPSLMNLLGEIGFSSVLELKWPTDHMYLDGKFCVHDGYVTVVAFKGKPIGDVLGLPPQPGDWERAPEDRSLYHIQLPYSGFRPQTSAVSPEAAPVGAQRPSLSSRLASAVRALRGRE